MQDSRSPGTGLGHPALKYTPLSVYVRDAFRISTWSLSSGLCFQVRNSWHSLFFLLAVIKQHCIAAGRTLLDWGELPVFVLRPHATEPRCPYHKGSVRIHVYIYIYIYIYIYKISLTC